MRRFALVGVFVSSLLVRTSALSAAQSPPDAADPCFVRLDQAKDAPKPEDFPSAEEHLSRIEPPHLTSRDARLYRTMLQWAGAQGPNFAAHFTIAEIGCGTSCSMGAIIDEKTGQVSFDPALKAVSGVYVDDDDRFVFDLKSSLLIVEGAPGEDEDRDGLRFYRWTGKSFRLLKFIPRLQACRKEQ